MSAMKLADRGQMIVAAGTEHGEGIHADSLALCVRVSVSESAQTETAAMLRSY